ncbi:MAG TPA: hypothetical protein VH640_14950 [Bryobacteraceae bacterium]|jgi:hypothetical protein
MNRRLYLPPIFAAAIAGFARADSITTADNLTLHGIVSHMDKDQIKVRARFSSVSNEDAKKGNCRQLQGTFNCELMLARSQVAEIQINRTDFNQGGPPSLGLRPGKAAPEGPQASFANSDTAVLRGGDRKQCGIVTIEDRMVHCPKANMDFDRDSVINILLGGK